jgi:hypothetical protein
VVKHPTVHRSACKCCFGYRQLASCETSGGSCAGLRSGIRHTNFDSQETIQNASNTERQVVGWTGALPLSRLPIRMTERQRLHSTINTSSRTLPNQLLCLYRHARRIFTEQAADLRDPSSNYDAHSTPPTTTITTKQHLWSRMTGTMHGSQTTYILEIGCSPENR